MGIRTRVWFRTLMALGLVTVVAMVGARWQLAPAQTAGAPEVKAVGHRGDG